MKVAIIGASSLTGNKLIEILAKHPKAELAVATSQTFVGKPLGSLYLKKDLTFEAFEIEKVNECDVVFSCLPHGKSMETLPQIVSEDKVVIDLGADFRTPADVFKKWYKEEHQAKEQTPAVYGLSEVFSEEIKDAKFIANPGCYSTSLLLGLAPLLEKGIELKDIGVFSLSGRSGAGREKAAEYKKHKGEILAPYKDGLSHQHIGEMEFIGSKLGNNQFKLFFFQPSVIPSVYEGMRTSIIAKCELESADKLLQIYEQFYEGQPFVKISPGSGFEFKEIVNTNNCVLGVNYDRDTKRLYIISVIDNLVKGASGQAIQNMNLALGFEQTLGLKED